MAMVRRGQQGQGGQGMGAGGVAGVAGGYVICETWHRPGRTFGTELAMEMTWRPDLLTALAKALELAVVHHASVEEMGPHGFAGVAKVDGAAVLDSSADGRRHRILW